MRALLAAQRFANFPRDMLDVRQVRLSALLAGRSHANEGNAGIANRLGGVRGGIETAGAMDFREEFRQSGIEQWRFPRAKQRQLIGIYLDADDIVALVGETGRRDGTNITKTEDADFHNRVLRVLVPPESLRERGASIRLIQCGSRHVVAHFSTCRLSFTVAGLRNAM